MIPTFTRRQALATFAGGAAATLLPLPLPALQQTGRFVGVLNQLNLNGGIQVALDIDTAQSVAGKSWRDLSGQGHHFLRSDNDEAYTLTQANPAWVNRLHRAGAKFTFALWVWFGGRDAEQHLVSTTVGNQIGMCFNVQRNSNGLQIAVMNGDKLRALNTIVLGTTQGYRGIEPGRWNFCAASLDEAVGPGGLIFCLDGEFERRSSTYVAPATADAQYPLRLGTRGNAKSSTLSHGSSIGAVGIWEGIALSQPQLTRLYEETKPEFSDD